jgi:hypothetical protein
VTRLFAICAKRPTIWHDKINPTVVHFLRHRKDPREIPW